nr:cyclin-dependent kinase C-1-like [Tanacetum cinerariifolium]
AAVACGRGGCDGSNAVTEIPGTAFLRDSILLCISFRVWSTNPPRSFKSGRVKFAIDPFPVKHCKFYFLPSHGNTYAHRSKELTEIRKFYFPITAIREIKILKKLQHDNVIKLKEIVTSTGPEGDEHVKSGGHRYKGSIYMVFEYMDHDLTGLADRPGMQFSIPQIKCYMRQLLTGLHYCHVNQVLHRDIKGSNLLIDNEGNLKLADFGLARTYSSDHKGNLTNRVITLWYRPPELLLGATKYGPTVDMWSVGCIFAELLFGKPILTGKNEVSHAKNNSNWTGLLVRVKS